MAAGSSVAVLLACIQDVACTVEAQCCCNSDVRKVGVGVAVRRSLLVVRELGTVKSTTSKVTRHAVVALDVTHVMLTRPTSTPTMQNMKEAMW